jgi:hypothetical protein
MKVNSRDAICWRISEDFDARSASIRRADKIPRSLPLRREGSPKYQSLDGFLSKKGSSSAGHISESSGISSTPTSIMHIPLPGYSKGFLGISKRNLWLCGARILKVIDERVIEDSLGSASFVCKAGQGLKEGNYFTLAIG